MFNVDELIERIRTAGFAARSYSGRGMYGALCLGVELDDASYLVELAGVPRPRLDSLGRGVIAYWPAVGLSHAQARELDRYNDNAEDFDAEEDAYYEGSVFDAEGRRIAASIPLKK